MGSCGDSADGWEETREGTRRRQGRRRGIICNVSTLGWAAWGSPGLVTSDKWGCPPHRHQAAGPRPSAGLLLCVSVLCLLLCSAAAAACWRSVEAEHGGSLAPVAAARPGLVTTPPTPAAPATPAASCRSCHAPGWWPPRPQLRARWAGRLLGGGVRCGRCCGPCGLSIDQGQQQATTCCCMVMSSARCSLQCVPVSPARHGTMGWCSVQCAVCSVSRAAEHQIIGWLIHFPSSNKLTNFALFPNLTTFYFYYVLRDPTWK